MKKLLILAGVILLIVIGIFWFGDSKIMKPEYTVSWSEYLGGPHRNHFSSLDQIHTGNVDKLEVAWEYNTGDPGQMQFNPIVANGILYGVSATNEVFALDASSGRELWTFADEKEKNFLTNRGVVYWEKGTDKRILFTYKEWLIALNAETGQPIRSFGNDGRVSLKSGLGENVDDKYVMSRTPGTFYENLIIMPLVVMEGTGSAPGYIQAFDVQSGKLVWVFHSIPKQGEYGHNTWPQTVLEEGIVGGANCWAGMAIDRERGILYAPTGSAAPDFYGGNRIGRNLFANSLLALDAKTGHRIWHYQTVRHDIWDRDLPAPPNLVTLHREGKTIDAVAQVTKSGHVFVFDRETGESIFPIEELEVPASTIPGESAWPTQPIPEMPRPFSRQTLTEADLNIYSPDYDSLLQVFRNSKKGRFVPLSETPTIIFPGTDGGAEWGGAGVDQQGIMYVNSNEMAWIQSLVPTSEKVSGLSQGEIIYRTNCGSCHGVDRSGNPGSGYPSLVNVQQRLDQDELSRIISNGQGMMPGFSHLATTEKQNLIDFLLNEEEAKVSDIDSTDNLISSVPWKVSGYPRFLDSEGHPAIAPPWGTLTAIDLNTGEHKWQIVLGDTEEYREKGIPQTGAENYGGPVVTAGGLLFIAATKDSKLRAFNKENGDLLWETTLPASGFATPSTYEIDGKQYLVIAAGGTKLGTEKGDSIIAFSLP